MQIAHGSLMAWTEVRPNHREGGIGFKYLLEGEDNSPDNFSWALTREGSDFYSPRHRHNWDQVRFCLEGSVPIGAKMTIDAGEVAYFAEGVPYGPQEGGDDRLVLVLQAGGASGQGYLGPRQLLEGGASLLGEGRFEKGVFRRAIGDGPKNQDGYEAVWGHVLGRAVEYPKPRYKVPVVMEPEAFPWRDVSGSPGVARRSLGHLSEREIGIEFLSLAAGATLRLEPGDGRRLAFVVEGGGRCGPEPLYAHSAVRLEPGEAADVVAETRLLLFMITLPVTEAPVVAGARMGVRVPA